MILRECPTCHRFTVLFHEMRSDLCRPLSPIIAEIVAQGEAVGWRRPAVAA